jgi:hypothetical protein
VKKALNAAKHERLYLKALNIIHERSVGLWIPIMWHLALRGHTGAMVALADWLSPDNSRKSLGKTSDRFSAAGLYYRAFRKGDPLAAYNAAMSSFNRDDMIGYRSWLWRAAKGGDTEATRLLQHFETRLWHDDARKVKRLRPEQKRDFYA